MSDSPFGDLRLHVDGATCTIPVDPGRDEAHECGGYTFRITEFQTDFKVGGQPNLDGPLINPMIRVEITAPDGATGERMLFAFHPDFSMGHGGGEDDFADLDMLYQINRGIEFAAGGATGVQGRASFAMQTMDMNTQEAGLDRRGRRSSTSSEEVLYASPEQRSLLRAGGHSRVGGPGAGAQRRTPTPGRPPGWSSATARATRPRPSAGEHEPAAAGDPGRPDLRAGLRAGLQEAALQPAPRRFRAADLPRQRQPGHLRELGHADGPGARVSRGRRCTST